jgi:stress response protein YsnF
MKKLAQFMTIELYEERLLTNKERHKASNAAMSKQVETHPYKGMSY